MGVVILFGRVEMFCPICKNKMRTYYNLDNHYSCKHEKCELVIVAKLSEILGINFKSYIYVFDSISILLALPNDKLYEIYMYTNNNLKTTIIYNYDSNPENIFGVNLDGFRKVAIYNGFLIDNYDYDKMVSKLNMVLNFQ